MTSPTNPNDPYAQGATPPPPGQAAGQTPQYSGHDQTPYQAAPQYQGAPAYGSMPMDAGYAAPTPVARPGALSTAVKLMWAGAGLSLLNLLAGLLLMDELKDATRTAIEEEAAKNALPEGQTVDSLVSMTNGLMMGSVILFGLLGALLWAWMASANSKGRKWARTLATIFGVINIILTLSSFTQPTSASSNTIMMALSVLSLLISLAALWFLWRPENKPYYEQRTV